MKSIMTLLRETKATLKGHWGMAIALLLIYSLIEMICQETVTILFLSLPIAFGVTRAFLLFSREGKALRIKDLFSAFNGRFYWKSIGLLLLIGIFWLLWSLLFIVPGIIKILSYSMAPYILADNPELSPIKAINESQKMMHGHKARLFRLKLLYIALSLLSCCLLWIPMIWIQPFFEVATAKFYEDVKNAQKPVEVAAE